MSLNSTTRVVSATSTCGPTVAADRHDRSVGAEHGDRLVHRAVIAVVVDDDLGPAADVPGEPERPAVRVGRRQRELPRSDTEPAGQLLADPGGVVRREHVGDAAAQLAFDGGDRRGRTVACHRPGVAEAQVDVVVAVDAGDVRAVGGLDIRWERPGPLDHPGHRHAIEERGLRRFVERGRPRVGVGEATLLGRHQAGEAITVESDGVGHAVRMAGPPVTRAPIPRRATRGPDADTATPAREEGRRSAATVSV